MLLRAAVAAAVVLILLLAYAAWKRPPRRLRRLSLASLGIEEPAIVQFTTRYCAPCRAAASRLRSTAERTNVPFQQVDVGERPEVARRFGIRTVPTIVVTSRGGRVVGVWTTVPENGAIAEAALGARTT